MKRAVSATLFFVGWVLSPFTWWNDILINIPISYLIANILFYITRFSFILLIIFSYISTNILGILFIYMGTKGLIIPSRHRRMAIIISLVAVIIYSVLIFYMGKKEHLLPISSCIERWYLLK